MSALVWIGAGVLGGGGAVARFLLDAAVASAAGRDLPVGTLVINLSGAFLLGLVSGLAIHGDGSILVGAAALGSYTTFSTWMFESQRLVQSGEFAAGLGNLLLSLAVGLGAVAIGHAVGSAL